MILEGATDDHAREPVPAAEQISGTRMALLISNTVVCVPNFLIGTQLVAALGMTRSVAAFVVGGMVLAAMTSITAVVGARANLSTSMILQFPFGRRGGRLVNSILLATILGNYAVIAAVFGRSLGGLLFAVTGRAMPLAVYTAMGSGAMIAVIIFGFRSLRSLAAVAVPLLVLLMGTMLYGALVRYGFPDRDIRVHTLTTSTAISAVIGSYVIGVVVLPDMMRYVKSVAQGVLATSFSMAAALPVFLAAAALIAAATGATDPGSAVAALGFGTAALVVLAFVSWTNNANNLYSASLVFAAIIPSVPKGWLVVIAGAIGTMLALLPVVEAYIGFLEAISVLLPPLAGIYVADFFLVRGQRYRLSELGAADRVDCIALGIWMSAAAVGALASHGVLRLSTIPGVDSMLVSFVLYALRARVARPHRAASSPEKAQ